MQAVLGIDLGLSSARAAVVARDGELLGCGRAEQPTLIGREFEGQWPEQWTRLVPLAVRQALAAAGDVSIQAIGLGALGPCPVLLDADLRPLRQAPLFSLDGRAEGERQALLAQFHLSGEEMGPDHVLPRLRLWQRDQPEQFSMAHAVVDAAGFLVFWLTGRLVIDPATLVDYWCSGPPLPLPLPEVLPSTAVAGGLRAEIAPILGLPSGTPVAGGTYDSFADLAGMGVMNPGDAGLLMGTTTVIGSIRADVSNRSAITSAGLRLSPHAGEGVFVGGWTSTSGSLIEWAKASFASEPAAPGRHLPGDHGLLTLPYFAGERAPIWEPSARGAVLGLSLSNTPAELHASVLEGVSLSILDIADRLDRVAGRPSIYRAGGGGFRNAAWAQETVDALGVPVETIVNTGEALGPAALAMRILGITYTPTIDREILPDERRHARYRVLLDIYRRLYPALRTSVRELNQLKSDLAS